MATLSVGSSVSVPIQGSEVFTITSAQNTSWRATFTSAAGAQQQQMAGTGRTYGPAATVQPLGPFNTPGALLLENLQTAVGSALTYSQTSGYSNPYVLAQTAVPVILPSSGSSNATGQITLTTALPYQPSGTVSIYLPTGVVTAGSAGTGAGLYSVVFSTTAICQIQGTGIVTANGAYTQTTASALTLATVAVPAAAMGANGSLRVLPRVTVLNNANTKTFNMQLGGSALANFPIVSNVSTFPILMVTNRGTQASQIGSPNGSDRNFGNPSSFYYTSVDTTAAQSLILTGNLATATDYLILEGYTVEVIPLQ